MKIGIDATLLTKEKVTGVESTLRNIVLSLAKIDSKNTYYLFTPKDFFDFPELPKNFITIKSKYIKFWRQIKLPGLLNKYQPDVFYSVGDIIPHFVRVPIISHFHDMAWFLHPDSYSKNEQKKQRFALSMIRKKAKIIITSSESSKTDLIKNFDFSERKIRVIPLGYNPNIKKYAIDQTKRQGIVYIGRLENKKNLTNLLKAYEIYATSSSNPEKLDLIGGKGFGFLEIENFLNQLKKSGLDIHYHGYLKDYEVYKILGQAKIMLFPTLYEGFGLPILEAFAARTAVISSNCSSIPEIAKDAAILVNPCKLPAIAAAIKQLLVADRLRLELIERGDKIVGQYSWGKTAKKVLEALYDVAGR
jgi:alpha-1,3-rhamnosyl/mannosyltransferase